MVNTLSVWYDIVMYITSTHRLMTSGLRSGVTNSFTATGCEPYLPEYTFENDPVPIDRGK